MQPLVAAVALDPLLRHLVIKAPLEQVALAVRSRRVALRLGLLLIAALLLLQVGRGQDRRQHRVASAAAASRL
jgi:hypothetical protein